MSETSVVPAVGKVAPKFKLPASGGREIALDDYRGKQVVVIIFSINRS